MVSARAGDRCALFANPGRISKKAENKLSVSTADLHRSSPSDTLRAESRAACERTIPDHHSSIPLFSLSQIRPSNISMSRTYLHAARSTKVSRHNEYRYDACGSSRRGAHFPIWWVGIQGDLWLDW